MIDLSSTISPGRIPELQEEAARQLEVVRRVPAPRPDGWARDVLALRGLRDADHRFYGSVDFSTIMEGAWRSFPPSTYADFAGLPDSGLLYFAEPLWLKAPRAKRLRLIAWERDLEGEVAKRDTLWIFPWSVGGEHGGYRALESNNTRSHEDEHGFLEILASSWSLLQQRDLIEKEVVQKKIHSKKVKRRIGHRPPPSVTVVDLRRSATGGSAPQGERKYQHRWVVNGHWRNQAHGPGRKDRRRIYVLPHVKGPEGAPMLETKKVYKW